MIIDCRKIAQDLLEELKRKIGLCRTVPALAIVLIGDNPASLVYVNNKIKRAETVGIKPSIYHLPFNTTQSDLTSLINVLNNDTSTHGIIVQLPLPSHINPLQIVEYIDPEKDVDGFHPVNVGLLSIGAKKGFVPCTPLGCLYLLEHILGNIGGKHAVIVGRSNIVGKPLAQLLINASCTVTVAHSKTHNLANITKQADIVVTAVGKPRMFRKEYFSPYATVIDVGINKSQTNEESPKVVGDVDFEDVCDYVAHITPVPGGVGQLTIAFLMKNTFKAYQSLTGPNALYN